MTIDDHIDLFTGIGGFSLAAQANGWTTRLMCEIDPWRREGLARAWPNVEIHDDIKTLDGSKYQGAGLVSAGVPCQPASRAGKQRGAGDDRWMWPATLAFIRAARPRWVLCENPPGIDDVGLGDILAEMESMAYEVAPPIGIPACAVNAPHRRMRYWLLAHAEEERKGPELALSRAGIRAVHGAQGILADVQGEFRRSGWQFSADREKPEPCNRGVHWIECREPGGRVKYRPVPDCLPRMDARLPAGVRNKLVAALGDTVVVPLVTEILRVVRMVEIGGGT